MTAYQKFQKTIKRCEGLVDTYIQLKSQSTDIVHTTKDILRAAVVLSVSALDAYITDTFIERFTVYIQKVTPDLSMIQLLNDAGFDTNFALSLLKTDRPYRKIRTLIEHYYSKYTTQKYDVIDKLFKLYGLKNLTQNAEKLAKRTRLKRSVEKLIERRHEIVHDGDYNSYNNIKDITDEWVMSRIQLLCILVNNMEVIINNRFKRL